ncbi:hypothetical protein KXD93_04655 [Mucilaginibacter sp. BJC16-A38]|uniref:hypothetical protein n=1 Tax=Mucilaginibacter phenanthrenivorans TaxID=1234842 RepID=UPI00215857B0|nr:hypothetical protein [Mucilaginibacter phenanthrenivorans]MCR8556916.1 hypothetical protein [Mucilaginibacter phenanthrenivorans]
MNATDHSIGILAYGSLIDDPGKELEELIIDRIPCQTPFNVEFARLSETRSNAPTLVPCQDGSPVNAVVLVLDHHRVTLSQAESMLWRRETRTTDTTKNYKPSKEHNPNKVTVLELKNFKAVATVLYTSIGQNTGIMNKPDILANFAIRSILEKVGEGKKDGIHYLLAAKKNGIQTKLSPQYEAEILKQTETKSLEEAIAKLDKLRPGNLARLAEAKKFEEQVIEIADFIGEYGMRKTLQDQSGEEIDMAQIIREKGKEFFIHCHTGFKEAQKRVLTLMVGFEDRKLIAKQELKAARVARSKKDIGLTENEIKLIEHRQNILRHLMDTIVWQMIKGQLYVARQLYQEVEGEKILKQSNLESIKAVVEQINANETDFALIADLTGYIQTGDLLCSIGGQLVLSEVKEGSRNHEILAILEKVQTTNIPAGEVQEKFKLDDKSFKQLKRQAKQMATMANFASIVNEDKGFDLSSGRPIKIITPNEPTHLYTDRLIALREQLDKRNLWAYDIIDDCLHVGIYKGHFRFIGSRILKTIGDTQSKNILMINYLSVIESLDKPLLFLPFDKEFIFDLMFGRVLMLFMIDIDKFMELYPDYGLKAEWGTRKESHQMREQMKGSMFIKNNKGIKIIHPKSKDVMWLAHGTFLKMVFDSIHPAYVAYSANYNFSLNDEEKAD